MSNGNSAVFTQFQLGYVSLKNRIVMAPMTRARAHNSLANEMIATYYTLRASTGLIIAESTAVSKNSIGMPRIPGMFTREQMASWQPVTSSVHKAGGHIFLQLLHTGRVTAKENFLDPSAVTLSVTDKQLPGEMFTAQGLRPYDIPKRMTEKDINEAIEEFAVAAKNAIDAGFDGIEIHGANGFLLDQFMDSSLNDRTDSWGGSIENRARLTLEIAKRLTKEIGNKKVGIRLSPFGRANGMLPDSQTEELIEQVVVELGKLNLAYVHFFDQGQEKPLLSIDWLKKMKSHLPETAIIVAGKYDLKKASEAIESKAVDLVAMGTPFIANPDLISRLQNGLELTAPTRESFYGDSAQGYIDFPLATEKT